MARARGRTPLGEGYPAQNRSKARGRAHQKEGDGRCRTRGGHEQMDAGRWQEREDKGRGGVGDSARNSRRGGTTKRSPSAHQGSRMTAPPPGMRRASRGASRRGSQGKFSLSARRTAHSVCDWASVASVNENAIPAVPFTQQGATGAPVAVRELPQVAEGMPVTVQELSADGTPLGRCSRPL